MRTVLKITRPRLAVQRRARLWSRARRGAATSQKAMMAKTPKKAESRMAGSLARAYSLNVIRSPPTLPLAPCMAGL
jgi:hypothetical protein